MNSIIKGGTSFPIYACLVYVTPLTFSRMVSFSHRLCPYPHWIFYYYFTTLAKICISCFWEMEFSFMFGNFFQHYLSFLTILAPKTACPRNFTWKLIWKVLYSSIPHKGASVDDRICSLSILWQGFTGSSLSDALWCSTVGAAAPPAAEIGDLHHQCIIGPHMRTFPSRTFPSPTMSRMCIYSLVWSNHPAFYLYPLWSGMKSAAEPLLLLTC